MYASVDLEGVGSDGVDGPPQALDGSVVAGGVGAMDTLADIAAAVVDMAARVLAAAGAQLQMYGGAMFVLDDKTRHKAPNEHIFNKGAIKRAELLDA